MVNKKIEYNRFPVVVGSFECTLCKTTYGAGGVLLDRGKGRLEIVCLACANNYLYVKEFVLPLNFGGLGNPLLYTETR